MATRLNFVFDPATGNWVHGNSNIGGNGVATGDSSEWIQNVAADYQGYIGPQRETTGQTTYAPSTQAPDWVSKIGNLAGGLGTLIFGVSSAIDGVPNAINYPAGFVPDPMNPNAPRYNQYGVPYQPGAPGTVPGVGSGFINAPIIAGLTGGHLLIGAAVLFGIVLIARKKG